MSSLNMEELAQKYLDKFVGGRDGCPAHKKSHTKNDRTKMPENDVFKYKEPYQIAGSLFKAIEEHAIKKFYLNVHGITIMHHELAIDICTMTEYMHHVRKNREDWAIVNMAVGITNSGCTNTEFHLIDPEGNLKISGCTGFSHTDNDLTILVPEIFEPHIGYGMRWKPKTANQENK